MVVSIDKANALKKHDKVRKYWAAERQRVEREVVRLSYLPKEERESGANQERTIELSDTLRARLAELAANTVHGSLCESAVSKRDHFSTILSA